MSTASVDAPRALAAPSRHPSLSLTLPVFAAVAGATSIAIGILWDISWHRSIGRDTFWTPAHMAIYLGGLLAGGAAAALVLRASFDASENRAATASVSVGPFRGPLGAFLMIWGAVAMIASAPFDDWWHNAYGLDVRVISPPHVVLAAGMIVVVVGALVLAVSIRNRSGSDGAAARGWDLLSDYASGLLLVFAAVFIVEYTFPLHQHSAVFYRVTALVFPFYLAAFARAGRRPSGAAATIAALVYTAVFCAVNWILPLFPAEPLLAPIYNPITRMVPFCFPLLLVFPAFAIDRLVARYGRDGGMSPTLLAVVLGIAFVAAFAAVQWPFALFQMTPAARNWFFVGDRYWSYSFHLDASWRYGFERKTLSAASLGIAAAFAVVSARLGLAAGARLARVVR